MYVLVVVDDGKIDNAKSFDNLVDARLAADEAAGEYDAESGDVAVFEVDEDDGSMKVVYNPILEDEDEDEDEDDET